MFIKRSLSVCSWFHVEGLLLVIFNQLKNSLKEKKRQRIVSFCYFPFLGDVRGPCPTQYGRECLSEHPACSDCWSKPALI